MLMIDTLSLGPSGSICSKLWHADSYALTIKRSDNKRGKVELGCDRGGDYRKRDSLTVEQRERKSGTRLIGCAWKAVGKRRQRDGQWTFEVTCGEHNHEASMDMAGYPSSRRLTAEAAQTTNELLAAGVPPRQIVTTLRQQHQDLPAIARKVYNARVKRRQQLLYGRSPIQALFDELKSSQFRHAVHCNASGRIERLFFAHTESLALAKRLSSVVLLDNTYKANRFRMPLFHVIGRTGLNTSFSVCFIFLSGEEIGDYKWALKENENLFFDQQIPPVIVTDSDGAPAAAIQEVSQHSRHLLCLWHIEKNVMANSKKDIVNGDEHKEFMMLWASVCRAKTPPQFEMLKDTLFTQLSHVLAVIKYLTDTWIPHKEKFVSAWTKLPTLWKYIDLCCGGCASNIEALPSSQYWGFACSSRTYCAYGTESGG
ncbi:hypothetical protein PsorP6_017976 [Peronosclerospora sorghi]|uniref:Uncharacterized protein n=1 Tax=Peronosclerospora sorghi TaxID=230839 RepID=A0ACC0WCG9_9STRA|nr:hypothetical protein PsorP6_017976 [Peronosclerospora sorghi]